MPRQGGLFDTISARKSDRDFSGRVLEEGDISTVLKYACGIVSQREGEYHRAQASGGGRYPIEVYPLIFTGTERIQAGVYHYGVKNHVLDVLWHREFTKADIATLFTYPWAQHASLALVFTGVFHRNQMKYGERGYRHVLIEAGAIIQNVYLVAAALGIKCCGIDGVNEVNLEKLLDVDGVAESAICSVVLG